MARTSIAAQSPIGSYPALPIASGAADLLFTATDDPTSRQTALVNGKTLVLAYNTDSVPHTITFSSVSDSMKRTGDITSYSVAAGHIASFGPFSTIGWTNNGQLYIDVSDPKLRLSVITLP